MIHISWPISSKHSVNGRYAESLHLPRCCWHSNVQRLPDLSSQSSLSVLRLLWRSRAKEGSYLKYKNRQTVEFFYSSAMTGTIIVIKWPFPEQSNNSAIITGEVQHVFFVCVLFLTAKKIKFLSFQLFLTYDETWRNLYRNPLKTATEHWNVNYCQRALTKKTSASVIAIACLCSSMTDDVSQKKNYSGWYGSQVYFKLQVLICFCLAFM